MTCEHFEVCGLAGTLDNKYCWLHYPRKNRNTGTFAPVLSQYLDSGKSDFRYMVFPEGFPNLTDRRFSSPVDFSGAEFIGSLAMQGVHLSHGIRMENERLPSIDLSGATIEGPVNLTIKEEIRELVLRKANVSGPFCLSAKSVGNINAFEARFSLAINIQAERLDGLTLDGAILAAGLIIKTSSFKAIHLREAESSGDFVIETKSGNAIEATNRNFKGDIKIQAKELGTLTLAGGSFYGNVTIEGYVERPSLAEATIHKQLRIERSEMRRSQRMFSSVVFASTSELYLNGTRFGHDLEILGRPPPKSVYLNATRVAGELTIHSELGERLINVIADENRPTLGDGAIFVNVDLSRFKVLGNFIDTIKMSNVKWARRYGRDVLYDEVVMRKQGGAGRWKNLKEAYQILKQKYSTLGDHASSGDFHYGEMEAKRREDGWRRRFLSLEFLYWALSGYGLGYIRAFLMLLLFLAGAGFSYHFFGGTELERDLYRSILFSLQTAALLRPMRPDDFSRAGELIQVAQSVLVPMQATLFILALRMRLKR